MQMPIPRQSSKVNFRWVPFTKSRVWSEIGSDRVFMADTEYLVMFHLNNNVLELAPAVTVNGKTPESCSIATKNGTPYALGI